MTVYGVDSFSRANQSGWGTASDGVNVWSAKRGTQTLSIASNEGVMTYNGSTTTGMVQLGVTSVGDSEMLVRCTQGTSTSDLMGICMRFKDTNNFYSFVQGSTAGQFQLRKDVANVFTTVAGVAFTSVVGTFYWIRARVIGTSFWGKIWQDGTAEPSAWTIGALGVTDASIAGPSPFGLVGTPVASSNVKFDSFYAIDYINSDGLSATDSFLGSDAYVPVDVLSANDSLLAQGGYSAEDDLVASDNLVSQGGFVPVDSLSALDTFLAQGGALWSDVVAVSDSLNAGGVYLPVDSLSAADGFAGGGLFVPIEALSAIDSLLATDIARFLDALSITDTFSGSETVPATPPHVNVTWLTRDGLVVWLTRDGKVTFNSRDDKVTWNSRG